MKPEIALAIDVDQFQTAQNQIDFGSEWNYFNSSTVTLFNINHDIILQHLIDTLIKRH